MITVVRGEGKREMEGERGRKRGERGRHDFAVLHCVAQIGLKLTV